jgi:hypothetical protein
LFFRLPNSVWIFINKSHYITNRISPQT